MRGRTAKFLRKVAAKVEMETGLPRDLAYARVKTLWKETPRNQRGHKRRAIEKLP